MAYQQLLSQQRGLSAFGHTPPLIQPPPTFSAHQPGLGLSALPTSAPNSNLSAKVTKVTTWELQTSLLDALTTLLLCPSQHLSSDLAVSSTVDPLITKRSKIKTEAEGLRLSPPCSPV